MYYTYIYLLLLSRAHLPINSQTCFEMLKFKPPRILYSLSKDPKKYWFSRGIPLCISHHRALSKYRVLRNSRASPNIHSKNYPTLCMTFLFYLMKPFRQPLKVHVGSIVFQQMDVMWILGLCLVCALDCDIFVLLVNLTWFHFFLTLYFDMHVKVSSPYSYHI